MATVQYVLYTTVALLFTVAVYLARSHFEIGRFCNWGGDNLLGNEIGGVTISWFEKGRVTNLFWFEFGRVTVPRSKMGG